MNDTDKLRAFAKAIVGHHTGTLEGCDIEDYAVEHGLLVSFEATEPCCEDECACAEVGFPATCYRATQLLSGRAE